MEASEEVVAAALVEDEGGWDWGSGSGQVRKGCVLNIPANRTDRTCQ